MKIDMQLMPLINANAGARSATITKALGLPPLPQHADWQDKDAYLATMLDNASTPSTSLIQLLETPKAKWDKAIKDECTQRATATAFTMREIIDARTLLGNHMRYVESESTALLAHVLSNVDARDDVEAFTTAAATLTTSTLADEPEAFATVMTVGKRLGYIAAATPNRPTATTAWKVLVATLTDVSTLAMPNEIGGDSYEQLDAFTMRARSAPRNTSRYILDLAAGKIPGVTLSIAPNIETVFERIDTIDALRKRTRELSLATAAPIGGIGHGLYPDAPEGLVGFM